MVRGYPAMRASNVRKCCCASTVVGQRMADLLARHRHPERRPQRHLGLAEADVAADEAVHRARRLQIAIYVVDGAGLIARLVERECRLEGAVVVVGRLERFAHEGLSFGVEAKELVGHLADLPRDAGLGPRERAAAELVELGLRVLAADVLLELIQAPDRQVQLVSAAVLDRDEIDGHSGDRLVNEALVAPDAVLAVHDAIARRKTAQVFEEGTRGVAALCALAPAVRTRAEDLLFGDEHEAIGRKDDAAPRVARRRLALRRAGSCRRATRESNAASRSGASDPLVAKEGHEPLSLRLRASRDEDAHSVVSPVKKTPHERRKPCALSFRRAGRFHGDRHVLVVAGGEVQRVAAVRRGHALEDAHPPFGLSRDDRAVEGEDRARRDVVRDGVLALEEGLR